MRCGAIPNLYFQELNGFYDALGRLQDGVSQMAKTGSGAELGAGLDRYVGQMLDLGHRLERLWSLGHPEPLRIAQRIADEAEGGLRELAEYASESLAPTPRQGDRGRAEKRLSLVGTAV